MKISEIINELTELQQYIGDKDLEACIVNDTTAGVNIMYQNDDGGITSTSLEGEKMAKLIKETTSDQEALNEFNVKVLHLDLCEASNDPDLLARADVEVTNDTSVITLNGLDLKHNDTTGIYSIVEPKLPSGVDINGFTCRAVTSAVAARYEQIKHSDEMLEKLATATSIDRKEYSEILPAITAHFDIDNMDVHDSLKKCRLELKAAYAYINYLENIQVPVTKDKDQVKQTFTEIFETGIKSVVNDSLDKIETACITALDKFCQQMDSTAYDEIR